MVVFGWMKKQGAKANHTSHPAPACTAPATATPVNRVGVEIGRQVRAYLEHAGMPRTTSSFSPCQHHQQHQHHHQHQCHHQHEHDHRHHQHQLVGFI